MNKFEIINIMFIVKKKEKQKQRLGSLIETLGVAFPHLAADLGLTLQMSDLEPTPGGV